MWRLGSLWRGRGDLLALENTVARAGWALACPFSSSDEFEAAVVKSKLDAGVYGPKRRRRYVLYAGAATSTLAVLVWMVGLAAYSVGMSWF
jgi:hypothetical protein